MSIAVCRLCVELSTVDSTVSIQSDSAHQQIVHVILSRPVSNSWQRAHSPSGLSSGRWQAVPEGPAGGRAAATSWLTARSRLSGAHRCLWPRVEPHTGVSGRLMGHMEHKRKGVAEAAHLSGVLNKGAAEILG